MAGPPESLSQSAVVIPSWRVPWHFFVHIIVGTSIFVIIAMPALFLSIAVAKLEAYHADSVIILGLRAGEYALFVVDLVLFFVFLWRTAVRTSRNL
jgi:hypothetical protein